MTWEWAYTRSYIRRQGASAFSSRDLFTLVGHGLLADGLFQAFAANLFIGNAAIVKADGTGLLHGRKAYHFRYSIPSLHKTWNVDWLGAHGLVGEEGEFWVDEADLTLLRLDVVATDIPPSLPLQSLGVTIEYRTLEAGAGRALIPETSSIKALEWNGTLHQEAVDFSHCRAFEAESNLMLGGSKNEELTKVVAHYETERKIVPSGLLFNVSLETPIDGGKTMVGDAITAVLESSVRTTAQRNCPQGRGAQGTRARVSEFG